MRTTAQSDKPTYLQVKIGISSTGCSPHVDFDFKKNKNRRGKITTIGKSMRKCCRIRKIWVRFVLIFSQKAVTKKIKKRNNTKQSRICGKST